MPSKCWPHDDAVETEQAAIRVRQRHGVECRLPPDFANENFDAKDREPGGHDGNVEDKRSGYPEFVERRKPDRKAKRKSADRL